MAADGQHEIVAQNLALALQQIGSNESVYHYGPGEVFRVRFYERDWWADEFGLIFMVRGGSAAWRREMNCEWEITRDFYVMASRKEDGAERVPWLAAPGDSEVPPTTVQNRLVDDVTLALMSDETLGGAADGIEIDAVEYGYHVEGWTNVELTVRVVYRIPRLAA